MMTMAADTPREEEPDSMQGKGYATANSPFSGSLLPAEIAAEIGRCLQARYQPIPEEPLPENLAALVRKLQERQG
jgi:hypothetical protein